ncbi:MAG: helix-turn-helix domain-containing protein [Sedimenticola sp.]
MRSEKSNLTATLCEEHRACSKPLSLLEAAAFLRMAPETLRRKARSGEVPAAKPGKQWIFIVEDLIQFVRSQYNTKSQHILSSEINTKEYPWNSSQEARKASITPISQRRTEREYESLLRPRTK